MKYDVRLRIGYRYAQAVKEARHVLRVAPRGDRGQTIERVVVALSPTPVELSSEADFFGNRMEHLRLQGAHRELSIEMRTRVEVRRGPPPAGTTTLADIAETADLSRDPHGGSPIHHLGASRLVAPVSEVTEYARAAMGEAGRPGLDAVFDLACAIRRDFAYEAGSTGIRTSVAEIFAQRRGVCQDFAHLMIGGLRGLGVPAAYVSGFLRTDPPPGQTRIEGADAMHAWVDVWLGEEAGWVGFDPTNACVVEDGHVIVGLGRDYSDVAPVDGVLTITGPQSTWHAVDIVPLDED